MMEIPKYESLWQTFIYSKFFRAPLWIVRKFIYRNANPKKSFTVSMRIGHKLELRPTQNYLKGILINRAYHDENVFLLKHFITKDAVILDIGANIGAYCCAYAKRYEKLNVSIYAIEALITNLNFLKHNKSLNKFENIKEFHLALGEKAGELEFSLPQDDFVGNAVGDNIRFFGKPNSERENHIHKVTMKSLDQWSEEQKINRCDFMKIDIEGAEFFVFKGGINFIKRCRPVIQCEFNKYWQNNMGLSEKDFLKFFSEIDYKIAIEKGNHYRIIDDINNYTIDEGLVDLLFVPKEKFTNLQKGLSA